MSMTLISTVTVGAGGASTIDFSSIAGTFTDLQLVVSGRMDSASAQNLRLRFNADTGANYINRQLYGDGVPPAASDTTSGSGVYIADYAGGFLPGTSMTSNTFGSFVAYIPNYAGSTAKSVSTDNVTENNATSNVRQTIGASRWTGTAAITQITILLTSGSFVQHSTASLYGILKGSGGATVS